MLGDLFLPTEMPEAPKESFFKGLFGGGVRSLDREELCKSIRPRFRSRIERTALFQSANRAARRTNRSRATSRATWPSWASGCRVRRAKWTGPTSWCWSEAISWTSWRSARSGCGPRRRTSLRVRTIWCSNTRTRNGTSCEVNVSVLPNCWVNKNRSSDGWWTEAGGKRREAYLVTSLGII